MEQYFFIPGRYPALTLAEIISAFKEEGLLYDLLLFSKEAAVFSVNGLSDIKTFSGKLGGVVKSGRVLDEILFSDNEDKFNYIFTAAFLKEKGVLLNSGKIKFALSLYQAGADAEIFSRLEKKLTELHVHLKDNLKSENIKAGFIRIKNRQTQSVSLVKNSVLKSGFELSLVASAHSLFVGRTEWVQDFEGFARRDFYKPAKDKRSGIMPVKLARMMLNLSGKGESSAVADPFAGSGTIILEAAIMGFSKIYGSDISSKAVGDIRTNLNWLTGKQANVNLFVSDVARLSQKLQAQSIDAFVTEPYLGPPLHKFPTPEGINRLFRDLTPLYRAAFTNFRKLLKKDGRVVIIFPAFILSGRLKLFELGPIADGFEPVHLLRELKIAHADITVRGSFLYRSINQFLIREIALFARK